MEKFKQGGMTCLSAKKLGRFQQCIEAQALSQPSWENKRPTGLKRLENQSKQLRYSTVKKK